MKFHYIFKAQRLLSVPKDTLPHSDLSIYEQFTRLAFIHFYRGSDVPKYIYVKIPIYHILLKTHVSHFKRKERKKYKIWRTDRIEIETHKNR